MAVDDALDELVGGPPGAAEPKEPEYPNDWTAFARPVTVTFLMNVFKMDRRTVQRRLAELRPIKYGRGNTPEYDFRQAASYLVDPRIDLKKYIATLKPTDLPTYLQDAYWSAALKRQKFEEQAGDLWRTSDVLDVLGDVFQTLKTTIQLFPDAVDRSGELTDKQRATVTELCDQLQQELHAKLVEMPQRRRTGPVVEEIEDDLEEAREE